MVNASVPVGVLRWVVTVMVEEPEVREVGLNDAVTPLGRTPVVSATDPLKPPERVTVTV